jgi:preprotein translocase subunit SecG
VSNEMIEERSAPLFLGTTNKKTGPKHCFSDSWLKKALTQIRGVLASFFFFFIFSLLFFVSFLFNIRRTEKQKQEQKAKTKTNNNNKTKGKRKVGENGNEFDGFMGGG